MNPSVNNHQLIRFISAGCRSDTEPDRKVYGNVLYLFSNPDLFVKAVQNRLNAGNGELIDTTGLLPDHNVLYSGVSTDHIITVNHLLTDSNYRLGLRVLCGMPAEFGIRIGLIKRLKYSVLGAGGSFGMGSSREQAVTALLQAGIRAVFAPSFGPIFEKNAAYLGLLTSSELTYLDAVNRGEAVPFEIFLTGKTGHLRDVILSGGLFGYLRKRTSTINTVRSDTTAMNIWQKRLAQRTPESVITGSTVHLPVDAAYSYVGLSGPARAALKHANGQLKTAIHPSKIFLFEDHFAYSEKTAVRNLTKNQRKFAEELNLPPGNYYFGRTSEGGGEGICHRIMLEKVNPATTQTVIATDSHTPTLGALPVLAIPVGSTLFAAGISHGQIPVSVSGVTRINLSGILPPGTGIRDAQLAMAGKITASHGASVIEFGGAGLNSLTFDQVVSICNMIPETFLGDVAVTEAYQAGVNYLADRYSISPDKAARLYCHPDSGRPYTDFFEYNLSRTVPWIALPGNPKNSVSLANLTDYPKITKAYIASCTNGLTDLYEAASVLRTRRVDARTLFLIVPSSQIVLKQAEKLGYIDLLKRAGATVSHESACGICIGDGKDAVTENDIAVSATNRNFPGRMGHPKGQVYLCGSTIAAISAVLGKIPDPEQYRKFYPEISQNLIQLNKPIMTYRH